MSASVKWGMRWGGRDIWRHRSSPKCHHTSSSLPQAFRKGWGWSPHICMVEISTKRAQRGMYNIKDLILDVKLKRARHQLCSRSLRDGVSRCQAIPLPADRPHGLSHQKGAVLSPNPHRGDKRVGFGVVEGPCQQQRTSYGQQGL